MKICSRLKLFREGRHKSQTDFANEIGINRSSYANYERGERSIPDDVKSSLSRIGLNLNWLITGEGSMYTVPQTVGQRLVVIREHYSMTKEEFSGLVSLTTEELTDIEEDRVEISEEIIKRLSGNLNVNTVYLYSGKGNMFTDMHLREPSSDVSFIEALPDVYRLYRENQELKESRGSGCIACETIERLSTERRHKVFDFAKFQLYEQIEEERKSN